MLSMCRQKRPGEEFQQQYFGDNTELAEGFKDDNPLATSDNYEVYMQTVDDGSDNEECRCEKPFAVRNAE